MQYMLLIYDDEEFWANLSDEERAALYAEYHALTAEMQANGRFLETHELEPTATARTVRVRDGERVVTDGPFAETKEQFGGYILIEADSAEEALEWAVKIPSARIGSVEVRPVVPAAIGVAGG